MNEIVSFKKEIEFNTMIDKIISIGIEHTLSNNGESNIVGDLIVSGTFRETPASQIDSPFSYKLPVDIVVDSKYDLSNMVVDIDDFTYNVDDNKLLINVSLLLDNLELKNNNDDEIISVDDLFLEKDSNEKLEIPIENKIDKDNSNEESKEQDENNISDSLFSNLNSSNETYKTYSVYILRDNDTIDDVILKYKVTREKLEEYNDLNNLKVGTKIIIPNYE